MKFKGLNLKLYFVKYSQVVGCGNGHMLGKPERVSMFTIARNFCIAVNVIARYPTSVPGVAAPFVLAGLA